MMDIWNMEGMEKLGKVIVSLSFYFRQRLHHISPITQPPGEIYPSESQLYPGSLSFIYYYFFFSNFILSNLPLFWALVTLIFPLALVTSFFLFLNLEMGSLSSFWLLNSSNPALQTHYVCKKSCCYHDKAKTRQRALTGCY